LAQMNKRFWEKLIGYFPLMWHRPHRKWCFQQFSCCCLCVHCHRKVLTDSLLSNRAIACQWWRYTHWDTQTHKESKLTQRSSWWSWSFLCNPTPIYIWRTTPCSGVGKGIYRHIQAVKWSYKLPLIFI
jgi:hypothetical protein